MTDETRDGGTALPSDKNPRNELAEGEASINKAGGVTRMTCCDCGLVHDYIISYDPAQQLVCVVAYRNEDETKKHRRRYQRKKIGLWSKEGHPQGSGISG